MPKQKPLPRQQPPFQPQPAQPILQAPAPQKPQTPVPPVAPQAPSPQKTQAPPGRIERERKLMKLSRARRSDFLKFLLGIIMLGAGGYVYLFRPVQLNVISRFISADYVAGALALIGIIIILYAEANERGARYYITQYRVVEVWGLLRKREHAIQLSQIEGVKVQQSFLNRLLGIGDVEIKTARDSLTLVQVGNPGKIEGLLMSELNRNGLRSQ